MVEILAVGAVISVLLVALSRPPSVVSRALVLSCAWVTVIPLSGASSTAIGIGLMTIAIMLAFGLVHGHRHREGIPVIALGIAFFALLLVSNLLSGIFGPIRVLTFVVLVQFALVASRVRRPDLLRLCHGLVLIMLAHLTYAVGEVWFGLPGIWPMSNGTNDISERTNTIFPALAGRPMTSFSHPIPFAFFLVVVSSLTATAAMVTRRALYWVLPIVGLLAILLSGTRSAVLTLVLVVAFLILFGYRGRLFGRLAVVLAAGGVAAWVGVEDVRSALGLGDEFNQTASYRHRTAVLRSFPSLFEQDSRHVLLGWGTDLQRIFDQGIVGRFSTSFYFFDNQFVATVTQQGVIGLLLLVSTLAAVFFLGDAFARIVVLAIGFMSSSFDTLDHLPGMVFLMIAVGLTAAAQNRRRVVQRNAASRDARREPTPVVDREPAPKRPAEPAPRRARTAPSQQAQEIAEFFARQHTASGDDAGNRHSPGAAGAASVRPREMRTM